MQSSQTLWLLEVTWGRLGTFRTGRDFLSRARAAQDTILRMNRGDSSITGMAAMARVENTVQDQDESSAVHSQDPRTIPEKQKTQSISKRLNRRCLSQEEAQTSNKHMKQMSTLYSHKKQCMLWRVQGKEPLGTAGGRVNWHGTVRARMKMPPNCVKRNCI